MFVIQLKQNELLYFILFMLTNILGLIFDTLFVFIFL